MSRMVTMSKSGFSSHRFCCRGLWRTSLFRRKKHLHPNTEGKLLLITGNRIQAVILQMFLYWTGCRWDFDCFLHEERIRTETDNQDLPPESSGWLEKTASDLYDRLSPIVDRSEVTQNLNALVSLEYLFKREDPVYPWEHTPQYRVNFVKLQKVLAGYGYELHEEAFEKRRGLWINYKV